jgi:copper chaperone
VIGEMMTEKTLKVPDLSCAHCKAAVEGDLHKISGVMYSKADVEKGTIEDFFDEGKVSTADLKGAIEGAGYTLAV